MLLGHGWVSLQEQENLYEHRFHNKKSVVAQNYSCLQLTHLSVWKIHLQYSCWNIFEALGKVQVKIVEK